MAATYGVGITCRRNLRRALTIISIAIGATVLLGPASALAGAPDCLDSSEPGDPNSILALRNTIETNCVCATFDGTKGHKHGDYIKCAKSYIDAAIPASLRSKCKGLVKSYYAKSTCGYDLHLNKRVCIKTKTDGGDVSCGIKNTTKSDGTTPNDKCTSKAGKYTQEECGPAFTKCIDIADTNGDLKIDSGDTGHCGAGTPFSDTCPTYGGDNSDMMIGFQGMRDPNGIDGITQIQAFCGRAAGSIEGGDPNGIAVIDADPNGVLAVHGSGGGSPWTASCPTDQVVVSFAGYGIDGSQINQLAFYCAPIHSDSARNLSLGAQTEVGPFGTASGIAIPKTDCPGPRGVADGVSGNANGGLDTFSVSCGQLPATGCQLDPTPAGRFGIVNIFVMAAMLFGWKLFYLASGWLRQR